MSTLLKTYFVNSSNQCKYPIVFGPHAIEALDTPDITEATRAIIVTNKTVESACRGIIDQLTAAISLNTHVRVIEDGECVKTMATVSTILDACVHHKMGRRDVLFCVGGGVVGDMAGFAASIYLRGIPFFHVPTSLLAQVDAAIGGKTGVNHPAGKNLIGTFCQPKKVFIDPTVLHSLPVDQMKEGLSEIIKYGIIMDRPLFWYLEEHIQAIQSFRYADCPDIWHYLIERSVQNKAMVVSQDEMEVEYREILNYGHTIGHAIESAMGYSGISHGDAIAIGMLVEAKIAVQLHHISRDDEARMARLIRHFHHQTSLDDMDDAVFFHALTTDKKVRQGRVRFVVPTGIGSTKTIQDVPSHIVSTAMSEVLGRALQ